MDEYLSLNFETEFTQLEAIKDVTTRSRGLSIANSVVLGIAPRVVSAQFRHIVRRYLETENPDPWLNENFGNSLPSARSYGPKCKILRTQRNGTYLLSLAATTIALRNSWGQM
jgi:hypothetical protein